MVTSVLEAESALQSVLQSAIARFPAVAVAAVVGGRAVCSGAAGSVNGTPASVERTVFLTASISKTVLAVVCLQCQERGELNLDDDICTYLPGRLCVRSPAFPADPITPKHLLTHTSGLLDDESALEPGRYRTEGCDCPVVLEEYVLQRLCSGGEDFSQELWSPTASPGQAAYHYSNAGYALLGCVVECATGRTLSSLAQERVFQPLGMSRTTYTLAEALRLLDTEVAVPCDFDQRPIGHYGVAEWPAAQLRSTASDLARFLSAFTGLECPILSQDSVHAMIPPDFKQGLAWWGRDAQYGDPRGDVWMHGGFMQGVRTHIYLWPGSHAGMVILTNGSCMYCDIEQALKARIQVDGDRAQENYIEAFGESLVEEILRCQTAAIAPAASLQLQPIFTILPPSCSKMPQVYTMPGFLSRDESAAVVEAIDGILCLGEVASDLVTHIPSHRKVLRRVFEDADLSKWLWQRLAPLVPTFVDDSSHTHAASIEGLSVATGSNDTPHCSRWRAVGLHSRACILKYVAAGHHHAAHYDYPFSEQAVPENNEDGEPEEHAWRRSFFTFMLYLTEGFEGGDLEFLDPLEWHASGITSPVSSITPAPGLAVLLRQGTYHDAGAGGCLPHRSTPLKSTSSAGQAKYVYRGDVMYVAT